MIKEQKIRFSRNPIKHAFAFVPLFFLASCGLWNTVMHPKPLQQAAVSSPTTTADSTKKAKPKLKPYKELITDSAKTLRGLLTIHRVEEKYYVEIADTLLGRDILVQKRISKAAAENRPGNGFMGYAGDDIGSMVIRFEKGANDKLFMRKVNFMDRVTDSTENGLYHAFRNSNVQPILYAFDVKALNTDSTGVIVDWTEWINGENDVVSFATDAKKIFNLNAFQQDKSYIVAVRTFPINTEVRTVKTFAAPTGMHTYELNSSLILLPKRLMHTRIEDNRIGYFGIPYADFDKNPQGVEQVGYISRWRLEPKEGEEAKYLRGELVEPRKQIVFYIDPATPKKWVPYLIKGVTDWNQAFEKAGFKNAISAREVSPSDSTWSLEDARYSAIVYKPSAVANAYGPHVADPRTGEILESHIGWFHNVMGLLRDWYMVQAGAVDERARKKVFDDELMGELIRFVCAHEVGHTLGLAHNFRASSNIPVEKLRDRDYLAKHGHTTSIMDYARFNYVAQPEDNVDVKDLIPRLGVYDEWAIEYGYRWFPAFESRQAEERFMKNWIKERVDADKRLHYTFEMLTGPTAQSEDLGDNAMTAGRYGIRNLKRIAPNIKDWATEPDESWWWYEQTHKKIMGQYQLYLYHVYNNIAKEDIDAKTMNQSGAQRIFPSREQMKEAVRFFHDELFETPEWLFVENQFGQFFTLSYQFQMIYPFQERYFTNLLSTEKLYTLMFYGNEHPKDAYMPTEYLADMKAGIWQELRGHKAIDDHRKRLQKLYAMHLQRLIHPTSKAEYDWNLQYGMGSILRQHAQGLLADVKRALPGYANGDTRTHLLEIRDLLTDLLDPESTKRYMASLPPTPPAKPAGSSFNGFLESEAMAPAPISINQPRNCWLPLSPEEELVHHSLRRRAQLGLPVSDAECCPTHAGNGSTLTPEQLKQFEAWMNRANDK